MLKKSVQPIMLQGILFNYINHVFSKQVDQLAAEYVLLNKTETVTPEMFTIDLAESIQDNDILKFCIFQTADIEGKYVKGGRLRPCDPRQAAEAFYDNCVRTWLADELADPLANAKKCLMSEFGHKFKSYCELTAKVSPSQSNRDYVREREYEYLRVVGQLEQSFLEKVIRREIKKGDNARKPLFPLYSQKKLKYKIDDSHFSPYLRNLLERRDNDFILRVDNVSSGAFLMAYAASLPFAVNEHRTEFLARLAAVIIGENLYSICNKK